MALQESRFLPAMMQKNSMQTAQQINEEREAKKAVVEDEDTEETAETAEDFTEE